MPVGVTALPAGGWCVTVAVSVTEAPLVTVAAAIELHIQKGDVLTDVEAYWLNLLPLVWLGFTFYRKDIPGDRTATNVGIWSLTPYAAYVFSPKELPESLWLSLCLFGWAFVLGLWRDSKKPA